METMNITTGKQGVEGTEAGRAEEVRRRGRAEQDSRGTLENFRHKDGTCVNIPTTESLGKGLNGQFRSRI